MFRFSRLDRWRNLILPGIFPYLVTGMVTASGGAWNATIVAEYLLAEMLDRQPDEVRHLLLCTCVLDRVNGELADLLTGCTGSERILLDLEDANAFVVSLDPGRTWFRYHHLFGDLLRLELRRTAAALVTGPVSKKACEC